jgi:hypothetical protein
MLKSIYIFIALILAIDGWNLNILATVINSQINPVYAVAWACLGFYWFRSRPGYLKLYNYKKYRKYFYWLIAGFLLSMIPAYVFWNQDFVTSLIVNRHLIWFIFLPLMFYMQPTEKEIIRALVFYTVVYMAVWTIQAVTPYPLTPLIENKNELGRFRLELEGTDFGYLLPGYPIMLLLLYFKMQQFMENVRLKTFIPVAAMLSIFFILQNRGTLFFSVIVFGFAIFRMRTRYKPILFFFFGVIVLAASLTLRKYWSGLIQETTEQLVNPDYIRWKAFVYFVSEYSPHWSCNILGNGLLSRKVESGQLILELMTEGYHQSDLGIIGSWSLYGILPLIVIYTVIFKILFHIYPFYIKAMAIHILLVPIVWSFTKFDSLALIIILYLFAYYAKKRKSIVAVKLSTKIHNPLNLLLHSKKLI